MAPILCFLVDADVILGNDMLTAVACHCKVAANSDGVVCRYIIFMPDLHTEVVGLSVYWEGHSTTTGRTAVASPVFIRF